MKGSSFKKNKLCQLLGIEFPIIQGGMAWCSGWELASAASNAGCLGVIGAGSMYPEILEIHIEKCRKATSKPFAVNFPLIYPEIEKHVEIVIREKVPIVITSAGNPETWTKKLKSHGIIVLHVVPGLKFAEKAQKSGVDAVIGEGFEAGGHNGKDETTTMVLIPSLAKKVDIPFIAAGGIGSGHSMLAAMALGADGVQIGTRFVISEESSAHQDFKQAIINSGEGDTKLMLKKLVPVRLLKNKFFEKTQELADRGGNKEEMRALLGKGRAKKGMFLGELEEGELEIGQVSANISTIQTTKEIVEEILDEYKELKNAILESGKF